ncbi:hypothetical protein [Patulibacter minatonensis]|uniref:hypothetical protein n=1 Tax=Patulibacter minatonensis TaxID=298163 RepID=UPI000478D045|nr:hypothetical protein [Patulibacter minatonensis]
MPLPRISAAVALTTLALAVTACGGDDKLDKGELNTKSGAICKEFEAKIKKIPQPAESSNPGEGGTESEQLAYFEKLAAVYGDFGDRLDDLEPADDVQDDWNALTKNVADSADATEQLVDQGKKKDKAGTEETTKELDRLSKEGDALSKKLGLTACDDI